MLRAIIVDDEKLSREVLLNYLKEYCTEVDIVATASSIKSAYKAIKRYSPDFIFLDIEMADGKGFDLLSMFTEISFRIIFVTAYSEYAVKAFRFSAVDYLLKPVKVDELKESVEKVKSLIQANSDPTNITTLVSNLKNGISQMPTLVISDLKGYEIIKISEIIMCQSDGYCTIFYLKGNRKITSSKNLKHFFDLLEEYNFVRIHHSYLVNMNHVNGFSRQGEIHLTDGLVAYLGDSFKNGFLKRIGKK